MNDKAYLSNEGQYTIFSYGDNRLKFIAPYSLEKYESVVHWDNGYLVVMAKYAHNKESEEEYIDLRNSSGWIYKLFRIGIKSI